ncbi:MAG: heat-inducible transcriptional repressor HrcA [Dehalococcoidia bacterium]
MLTQRREEILRIIVDEYTSTGVPVGSETVARKGMQVSSATIRNEMNELEGEGYLAQPHTSAGRIPSDRGYRHYIESLMGEVQLSSAEQRLICHQFHQVEREVEEWTRLAASVLSHMLHNVAIVTLPKHSESRLQHLELVSLQEFLILLVLILKEAKLKQQMLTAGESVTQEELNASAMKLNSAYGGLAPSEIPARDLEISPFEAQVVEAMVQIMHAEEEEEYEEPYVDGLRHMLSQPEFASSSKIADIVEILEQKSLLKSFLPQVLAGGGMCVVIGSENRQDVMSGCSVVMARYGVPGEVSGAVGVMGPTRMRYDRAIPAVYFLASLMSEMVSEFRG